MSVGVIDVFGMIHLFASRRTGQRPRQVERGRRLVRTASRHPLPVNALSNLPHYRQCSLFVSFSVNLRHLRVLVSQHNLRHLKAVFLSESGCGIVSKSIRAPTWHDALTVVRGFLALSSVFVRAVTSTLYCPSVTVLVIKGPRGVLGVRLRSPTLWLGVIGLFRCARRSRLRTSTTSRGLNRYAVVSVFRKDPRICCALGPR